ncbi:MAG: glycosyltransferase [Bacilli bacterium]|nr:glycosyltransferase [Bacilli bacterium]
MKKILIASNHLQTGDGVCRILISFANMLVETGKYDVTITFMLRFDKSLLQMFDKRIKIRRAFPFPCFKGYDRLMSFLPGRYLYNRVARKEKYDLEIGFCWRNPTIAISSSTNKDARHIIYTHGSNPGREYYVKNDAMIAISSESLKKYSKDIDNQIPIYRFSNIFDEQLIFKQADESPLFSKKDGRFLFVTVGRLTIEKGLDRMMNAAQKLYEEGYDFDIWHVGEGKDRKLLEDFIKDHHLEEKVTLLGNQPNPYPYMKQADCLVCASQTEGYSTACVESCILEVPFISTAVSGAQDIVDESKAGKVFPNTEEGIYQGMKYVLDHKDELLSWKSNLKKTKTSFYKEGRKKALLEILDKIESM